MGEVIADVIEQGSQLAQERRDRQAFIRMCQTKRSSPPRSIRMAAGAGEKEWD